MRPDLSNPVPGRSGWRASQRIRLSLLLACAAALALWFAAARTGALGHTTATAPCPLTRAPRVVEVSAADLSALRASVARALPDRIGRLYEEGTVEGANLWTDGLPSPPPALAATPRSGGYEMRWWAPNRDDIVADVLLFHGPAQARAFLARAASPQCRSAARAAGARWPSRARNLRWVNPDAFAQADVLFARGFSRLPRRRRPARSCRASAHAGRSAPRLSRRRHPRLSTARRRVRNRRGVHAGMSTSRAFNGFACAALLAASALLAGCGGAQGGSANSTGGSAGSVATGSPRRPPRGIFATRATHASAPISVAAAESFAHAINLTAADVPGATARKHESYGESSRERHREKHAFAKCLGIQPTHEIVAVKSPRLDRGAGIEDESFTSSVTVVAHPFEAEREIMAVRRFGRRSCLARLLRRRLLGENLGRARFRGLRISVLRPRVGGATASAGLRIELMLLTARGRSIPLYTDELAFALGSAEIQLAAFSIAQPVASTTEQELLSLLSQRAHAHPL